MSGYRHPAPKTEGFDPPRVLPPARAALPTTDPDAWRPTATTRPKARRRLPDAYGDYAVCMTIIAVFTALQALVLLWVLRGGR